MQPIIEWCNTNSGFLTGVLSLVGLLLSCIAIFVSIRTARMPYKRKLVLSSSFMIGVMTSPLVSKPMPMGLEASATNVGNCTINITYLGYAVKKERQYYMLFPISRSFDCKGVLAPTEIKSVQFTADEMIDILSKEASETPLYVYAIDSGNKRYKRKSGTVGKLLENIAKAR